MAAPIDFTSITQLLMSLLPILFVIIILSTLMKAFERFADGIGGFGSGDTFGVSGFVASLRKLLFRLMVRSKKPPIPIHRGDVVAFSKNKPGFMYGVVDHVEWSEACGGLLKWNVRIVGRFGSDKESAMHGDLAYTKDKSCRVIGHVDLPELDTS